MTEIKKQESGFPQEGEIVLGTVSKVSNFGAFVKLDEYPEREGMLHISEIASKWIKSIREYVKEGQKIVVKVLKINVEKGHIDLSLKSVKEAQRKGKLESIKRQQRARKLVELAAKHINDTNSVNSVIEALEKNFEDIYAALESVNALGEGVFEKTGLSKEWCSALAAIAKEYIQPQKVSIKAVLELTSNASNGAEVIRNALYKSLEGNKRANVNISMKYLGAPRYKIEIEAQNYKLAEACLNKIAEECILSVRKAEGDGKLIRQ